MLHWHNPAGFPHHRLRVKVGCVIMLTVNLPMQNGVQLRNGTRMQLTSVLTDAVGVSVMVCKMLTGAQQGREVHIARKALKPDDHMPWAWTRTQFPVRVCYAMTINKSQGQTLKRCGVLLTDPVFAHGQLYVALSRVGDPSCVAVLIPPDADADGVDGSRNITRNVVWQEVLQ